MIAVVLLLIAVSAFLGGFLYGCEFAPKNPEFKAKKAECKIERLTKEYENFLNYDGSEQI